MGKRLVAYFSASGVTKQVAEKFAKAAGADLFEIRPVEPYTDADLNWKNPLARCNREWIGRKAVPVEGVVEHMSDYETVYLGFPIWYGIFPNIVGTFVKQYDFSGKKIVLFATSGGSGMGKTAAKLREQLDQEAEITDLGILKPDVTEEKLKDLIR